MVLKSLFALVGTVAALAGSSKLATALRESSTPQTSLEVTQTTTTLEDIVPPTPIEAPEAEEIVELTQTPQEVSPEESKVEEIVPAPKNVEPREPIYYGRYSLKKYFAGGPGHRHAAFAPKTNFFGEAEHIKRNDSAIWNYFAAASTNGSTDEDILESACRNLSNRDKIHFDGKDYLKNKIKGYCFTQIGFKL